MRWPEQTPRISSHTYAENQTWLPLHYHRKCALQIMRGPTGLRSGAVTILISVIILPTEYSITMHLFSSLYRIVTSSTQVEYDDSLAGFVEGLYTAKVI